ADFTALLSETVGSRHRKRGAGGAAGPRPITQSELATALALASTPESSSHTPTPGTQGHSSGTSPNVLQRPVRDAHHQRSLQPSPAACPAGLRAAQPS
ncbi:hypothetical protein K5549_021289, partial [Capra hircus]